MDHRASIASTLPLLLLPSLPSILAQQVGKYTPEVHPLLPSWDCTVKEGCVAKNTNVVLDSDYRWTHAVDSDANCKGPAGLNRTLCPDAATCGKSCALEGVDYGGYGVFTNGSELTLQLFINDTATKKARLSSPRVYLLANDSSYEMFHLLDREFTFDVDMSQMPCGSNGALYFSEMLADGGKGEHNPAGPAYGTGYCDAQCPSPPFINGEANLDGYGACCNEMDIWEANSAATAFTPHPCNVTGVYKCKGALCGTPDRYGAVCDKDGCDYNPYRLGQLEFYQPNATLATDKPFTVVTQFLTTTGDGKGDLREIRRLYLQGGKLIENALIQVAGINKGNSMTDEFCAQEKKVFGGVDAFKAQGGMKGMGEAFRRGMVLAMSVWDDAGSAMKWLDGTYPPDSDPKTDLGTARGPCKADEYTADALLAKFPGAKVKFSNIKSGEIGSTFKIGSPPVSEAE